MSLSTQEGSRTRMNGVRRRNARAAQHSEKSVRRPEQSQVPLCKFGERTGQHLTALMINTLGKERTGASSLINYLQKYAAYAAGKYWIFLPRIGHRDVHSCSFYSASYRWSWPGRRSSKSALWSSVFQTAWPCSRRVRGFTSPSLTRAVSSAGSQDTRSPYRNVIVPP